MSNTPAVPSGARHPVNIGHLVMGVAFIGLTLVWSLVASDTVEGSDVRWLMPIPWVAAGIAGVLATVLTNRSRWGQNQTGWVTSEADTSSTETTTETTDTTDTTNEENR